MDNKTLQHPKTWSSTLAATLVFYKFHFDARYN